MPNTNPDEYKYPVTPYLDPRQMGDNRTFTCKYIDYLDEDYPEKRLVTGQKALWVFTQSWSILLEALHTKNDDEDAKRILAFYKTRRRELTDHTSRTIYSILNCKTYIVGDKDRQKLWLILWRLFKINDDIKYSYFDKRIASWGLFNEIQKINDLESLIGFYNEHIGQRYLTMRRNPYLDRLFFNQNYTQAKINFIEDCRERAAHLLSQKDPLAKPVTQTQDLEQTIFNSSHNRKGVNNNSYSVRYFNDYNGTVLKQSGLFFV